MKKFNDIREENEKLAAKNDSKETDGKPTETKEWKIERSKWSPMSHLWAPLTIYPPIHSFVIADLYLEDLFVILAAGATGGMDTPLVSLQRC